MRLFFSSIAYCLLESRRRLRWNGRREGEKMMTSDGVEPPSQHFPNYDRHTSKIIKIAALLARVSLLTAGPPLLPRFSSPPQASVSGFCDNGAGKNQLYGLCPGRRSRKGHSGGHDHCSSCYRLGVGNTTGPGHQLGSGPTDGHVNLASTATVVDHDLTSSSTEAACGTATPAGISAFATC